MSIVSGPWNSVYVGIYYPNVGISDVCHLTGKGGTDLHGIGNRFYEENDGVRMV